MDYKKKKKNLLDNTKDLMGVGITGMAGLGAMGQMSTIPGMPAQANTLTPIVGAGVNIAGIGATLNITKDIFSTDKKKCKRRNKK